MVNGRNGGLGFELMELFHKVSMSVKVASYTGIASEGHGSDFQKRHRRERRQAGAS